MDLTNSHASGKIKDILVFFKDIFSEGIGNDEYIFMGDTFGDDGGISDPQGGASGNYSFD